jgi:hypothetical protein
MQSWQVEHVRDKVDEMAGSLNIQIHTATDIIYKIWYNQRDDVALYGRVSYDKQSNRDKLNKALVYEIVDVINRKGTRICVRYRNHAKQTTWFGPENDMKPVNAAYAYIMAFKKHGSASNVPKNQSAKEAVSPAKKQP